jgi:hypothetical protein
MGEGVFVMERFLGNLTEVIMRGI